MKIENYEFVIPECLYRESSGFAACKAAGSPTKAFGDDDAFLVNGAAVKGNLKMGRRRKIAKEILPEERARLHQDLLAGKLTLAETSRRIRELLDMDQDEYAKLANIAPRTLIDLETGKGNPTLKTLEKLGKPFGLSLVFRPGGGSG